MWRSIIGDLKISRLGEPCPVIWPHDPLERKTVKTVAYLGRVRIKYISVKTRKLHWTHVAPAIISSIVFDFARIERMRRYDMVNIIITITRSDALWVILHRMTGAKRSIVIMNKSSALAARLIKDPE